MTCVPRQTRGVSRRARSLRLTSSTVVNASMRDRSICLGATCVYARPRPKEYRPLNAVRCDPCQHSSAHLHVVSSHSRKPDGRFGGPAARISTSTLAVLPPRGELQGLSGRAGDAAVAFHYWGARNFADSSKFASGIGAAPWLHAHVASTRTGGLTGESFRHRATLEHVLAGDHSPEMNVTCVPTRSTSTRHQSKG